MHCKFWGKRLQQALKNYLKICVIYFHNEIFGTCSFFTHHSPPPWMFVAFSGFCTLIDYIQLFQLSFTFFCATWVRVIAIDQCLTVNSVNLYSHSIITRRILYQLIMPEVGKNGWTWDLTFMVAKTKRQESNILLVCYI